MKKWLLILAAAIAVLQFAQSQRGPQSSKSDSSVTEAQPQSQARKESNLAERSKHDREPDNPLAQAFRARSHNVQISGEGVVARVLADDSQGSRHQRFLLRMPSGQTVLIAHNIDLAPRLDDLRTGETVAFNGEYEWNERGGVIHWTHRDPGGRHPAGWLRRGGRSYQ